MQSPDKPARAKLSLFIILTLMFVVFILTLLISEATRRIVRSHVDAEAGVKLSELAFQTTDKLDRGLFERYREMKLLSGRPILTDPTINTARRQQALDDIKQTYPIYAWIGVTDMKGKVLVATGHLLEGIDVSTRPWFGDALKGVYLHDVHDAKLLAKLLPSENNEPKRFIDVAFPYYQNGQAAGVVGAHLSWSWASEIRQSVVSSRRDHEAIDLAILSHDGKVLLGPPDMKSQPFTVTKEMLTKTAGYTVTTDNDKSYLVGYSRTKGYRDAPGLEWIVLVRQPLDAALLPVATLQKHIYLIGFGIALLVALFAFAISRIFIQPLNQITRRADRIAQGYEQRVILPNPRFYEIAKLRDAINHLVDGLTSKSAALKELNDTLEQQVVSRTEDLSSALARVQLEQSRTNAIISGALDAFVAIDGDGNVVEWNTRAEEMFGYTRTEAIGNNLGDLIIPREYRTAHAQGMKRFAQTGEARVAGKRVELTALRKDGTRFAVDMAISLVPTAQGTLFSAFIQDISIRKEHEAAMAKFALEDSLTGLPNRRAFMKRLAEAIDRAQRQQQSVAVLFMDLNKFKAVNDTYGHDVGDQLLIAFSQRVSQTIRKTDYVARLGGDEFVVIAENLKTVPDDVMCVANKIITSLAVPLLEGDIQIHGHTSIGICVATSGDINPDDLLKHADDAMYRAKQRGQNQTEYVAV